MLIFNYIKSIKRILLLASILLIIIIVSPHINATNTEKQQFVVVLDAGHGGHDAGAIGIKGKEKNINLNVVLKLGKLIEDNMPDVKVVYTRKTDVFVGLKERTQIAHRNHGNLFISIHANSVARKNKNRKTINGASTYVLGTSKNEQNLEVAQRENAVMLLEEDYSTKYEGFDPNSPESYIIFETMQDQFRDNSISYAALVQSEMTTVAGRKDRGVRQNGFYVLAFTGMPSVLVELDFICNPTMENYMLSDEGQAQMAQALFNAFVKYKASYDGLTTTPSTYQIVEDADEEICATETTTASNTATTSEPPTEPTTASTTTEVIDAEQRVYKVQFMALPNKLGSNNRAFKGLSPVEVYYDKGLYKYTYGASTTREGIEADFRKVKQLFRDAFIIVMQNGKRVE